MTVSPIVSSAVAIGRAMNGAAMFMAYSITGNLRRLVGRCGRCADFDQSSGLNAVLPVGYDLLTWGQSLIDDREVLVRPADFARGRRRPRTARPRRRWQRGSCRFRYRGARSN